MVGIDTGVRQGCILSPTLFNIVLDYIMKRLETVKNLGGTMTPEGMEDAEYADDTCLLAECLLRVMKLTEALATESAKFGLKINMAKTKVMPVTNQFGPWPKVMVHDEDIDVVDNFTYLGSDIQATGGTENETVRRIALAGSVFNRLHEKVFKRHDIKLKTKLRIYNASVVPVLTYGAESWAVTEGIERRLDTCENKWLRRILRIKYEEHVTNKQIRERTGQQHISNYVRKRIMTWAGHVMRMEGSRAAKRIYEWQPAGKRRVGRPRTRWKDGLERGLKKAGLTLYGRTRGRERKTLQEIAVNRDEWKGVVRASTAGHSHMMIT